MSRRNRRARRESEIFRSKSLRIVCTDRSQHPEVSFGDVDLWPEPDEAGVGWDMIFDGVRVEEWVNTDEYEMRGQDPVQAFMDGTLVPLRKTYPFVCRRCRRNKPLREETLRQMCAALASADAPKLDISLI